MSDDADGRMSLADFQQFIELFRRFADEELDQFENWRWQSKWGPVYVSILREPPPGWTKEMYDDLPRLADQEST